MIEMLSKIADVAKASEKLKMENYKKIKPEGKISVKKASDFWSNHFNKQKIDSKIGEPKQFSFKAGVEELKDRGKDQVEIKKTDNYFSTYEERLQHTPKEISDKGEWQGKRGESKYIPNNSEVKEILKNYKVDGITYKDAIPDFSVVAESTVEIDKMTKMRPDNFKQCDAKCAEQWNKQACNGKTDWSARDISDWRKENGYTWHERNDMKTCDLVPTKVHECCGHLGGVSECKKRDAVVFGGAVVSGGDFDE